MLENHIKLFEFLDKVLGKISLRLVLKDTKNNIIRLNDKALLGTGLAYDEIIGKNCDDLFGDTGKNLYLDDLKIIETKLPILDHTEKLVMGDVEQWVKTDKLPFFDKSGEVVAILVIAQDITKQMQSEIDNHKLRSYANIGINAAEIVHNLKNPLAVAVYNTRKLKKQNIDQATKDLVSKIERAHQDLLEIVSNILNSSKKTNLEVVPTDLRNCIYKSVERVEQSKDRDIREYLAVEIEDDCLVAIDEINLCQIFNNLLSNAVEELGDRPNKVIKIRSKVIGRSVIVKIEDNGGGISKEYIQKIFETGFSTKEYDLAKNVGTGLGLSFVKRMLELYDGGIEVDSSEEGTSFSLFLPIVHKT